MQGKKIEELGSHTMFIADVVGVTVDDKYMDGTGKFHINDTGLVMYSHGEYFGFGDKLGSFGYSVRKLKIIYRSSISMRYAYTSSF